ncbi:hypothetical protein BH24ACT9_BH24ACT9_09610 [soil metagenome]
MVLYDRWGTGLSDRRRADFSAAAVVQVLVNLVDQLRLRRFALFGPSHGGPIAAGFAGRFPRRVSHLILYGARSSGLTGGPTWTALRELMLVNWPVAVRSIAAVATKGGDPGDVDAFAELLQAAATPEMTVALQDAAGQHDAYSDLGRLGLPTLVLHRRGDSLVSAEAASRIAGAIPGARLELLAGEAHVHTVGDAGTLAGRILAFTAGSGSHSSAQLSSVRAARGLGASHAKLRVSTDAQLRHCFLPFQDDDIIPSGDAASALQRPCVRPRPACHCRTGCRGSA